MSLNPRQFPTLPGMEHLAPAPQKAVSASPGSTEALMVRLINRDAPVGHRGSLSTRRAIGRAKVRKEEARQVLQSTVERHHDHGLGRLGDMAPADVEDAIGMPQVPRHHRTGLPVMGEIREHLDPTWDDERNLDPSNSPNAIGFAEGDNVPHWAEFHGSTRSAWRKHGTVEHVPTPLLTTHQDEVTATRLHAAIENPEANAHPRFAGLGHEGRELPRVFHAGGNDYRIVDGNHRLSADLLQGRLFSEARVVRPSQRDAMDRQNTRIRYMRQNAKDNPNAQDPMEQRRRVWQAHYGTDP